MSLRQSEWTTDDFGARSRVRERLTDKHNGAGGRLFRNCQGAARDTEIRGIHINWSAEMRIVLVAGIASAARTIDPDITAVVSANRNGSECLSSEYADGSKKNGSQELLQGGYLQS